VQLPIGLAADVAAERVQQRARLALQRGSTCPFICHCRQGKGGGHRRKRRGIHQQPSCLPPNAQKQRRPDAVGHTRHVAALPILVQRLQLLQARRAQLRLVDEILLHLFQSFIRVGGLGLAPRFVALALLLLDLARVVAGYLVHDEGVEGGAQGLQQRQLEEVGVGAEGRHDFDAGGKFSGGEGEAGDAVGRDVVQRRLEEGVAAKGDGAAWGERGVFAMRVLVLTLVLKQKGANDTDRT
jgi:hypothetical protein